MDTLERLHYIRERINETEKESFDCLEKDWESLESIQQRLVNLQRLYMDYDRTATHAG